MDYLSWLCCEASVAVDRLAERYWDDDADRHVGVVGRLAGCVADLLYQVSVVCTR